LVPSSSTPLLAAWLERFSELDVARAVLQDVDRVVEQGMFLVAKNSAQPSNN
jgi:glutathione S-transferase